MLTRGSGVLVAFVALVSLAASASHAEAETSVSSDCVGSISANAGCAFGSVTVAISVDGQQGAVTLVDDGSGNPVPVCRFKGAEVVPCESSDGWWSAERNCYVRPSGLSPSDPVWQDAAGGQSGGDVYWCTLPPGILGPGVYFWSEAPPVVADQQSVMRVAAEAVQSLGLRGVTVGMTPPVAAASPESVGLVGLPNWLWVQNPDPQSWGPVSGTATDSGLTVTVTARAQRVTWSLGDDSAPVVCASPGTPWSADDGAAPSPDCGRAEGYQKAGVYPVTAVSHWTIAYSSNVGMAGSLSMDLTTATTVTIAEAQVINR